ncbi:TPA: RNA-directed DNA polymerase [Stenotrophomonas maltophilia]|uniref:reverse transcriptase family protein n=1 Tax=Stenotrophomonas maltophilia TaxID=40324 RepID=UPI0014638539|nr:reverse transcriptase family protein [Stenotrophomonas maltophilia]MBH1380932.1 RNA-directed DNA polymerase [Stenotrophomonas maltophilia]MBH1397338.1 RNA-directed DNA polymerase [Stenotrophomonas maltophilia]MBH1469830.1 RNA-directed DNA polymerase [Stenotrophomonas maltophilia]MBH1473271.1 RNA-directed DNA polymerase [Stenotrophomonas maltophilia]QJP21823.1 RNA-directed DNA polymerase [Stenotrophomonas maltophilia]
MTLRGSAGPIRSNCALARALGCTEKFLSDVIARDTSSKYRLVEAPAKLDGTRREVYSPSRDVRLIQRRIVNRFFKNPRVIKWPPFIYGGIHRDALAPGESRDHVACAQKHCGARSMVKLDIRSFFDNVTHDMVVETMVMQLGWSRGPAILLADLCTRDGSLPQGGITSSYLALLSIYDVESKIFNIVGYKKLVYTRYVDDITISSRNSGYDFSPIVKMVDQFLLSKGLSINDAKTSVSVSGLEPLVVHGLNVANKHPVLPKAEVKRIKSVSRQTINDASEEGRRTHGFRRRYYRSMGLINKLSRVRSSSHKSSLSKLKSVSPLPNFADYDIATVVAYRLRDLYGAKKGGRWYWRKFNVLMARLDLIAVENPGWAKTLRRYMRRHYRPDYRRPE